MKTIKVTQCHVGRFDLLSNKESLCFYMGIYEDNKLVEVEGVLAQLHYDGEPDELDLFRDAIGNLGYVFQACYKYAGRVWSSTNYTANCLLFAKIYSENMDEINTQLKEAHRASIEKQIEELQRKLEYEEFLWDISTEVNQCINKDISLISKWKAEEEAKISQLKEGSDMYEACSKKITGYANKISDLQSALIIEA